MRKTAIRLILGSGVTTLIAACSARAPTTASEAFPPSNAPPQRGAPLAASGGSQALFSFEGSVDVASKTIDIVYRARTGEILAQSTLPYGEQPGEVYFHTCSGTVAWTPSGAGGTLTGTVQAVNLMTDTVIGMTAVIDSVSDPINVTYATPLASYASVAPNTARNCGAPSASWTFNDLNGENFSFTGEADGTIVKRIFVTKGTTTGDIGGLAAADTLCQNEATAAGLSGTYMAFLSSDSVSAASRLGHSSGPYELFDGTEVAASWAGLVSGAIMNPIDENADGTVVSGTEGAWTGSTTAGASVVGDTCSSWTIGTSAQRGELGETNQTDSNWSSTSTPKCNGPEYLYCLEQ